MHAHPRFMRWQLPLLLTALALLATIFSAAPAHASDLPATDHDPQSGAAAAAPASQYPSLAELNVVVPAWQRQTSAIQAILSVKESREDSAAALIGENSDDIDAGVEALNNLSRSMLLSGDSLITPADALRYGIPEAESTTYSIVILTKAQGLLELVETAK